MAKEYFSDLNYTLANEDTRIEFELLEKGANRVFSISGSGARCLPLLAKNPEFLDVIDMSKSQLFLCELRHQAMKSFSYEEYLFFMGYRGGLQDGSDTGDSREKLFTKLNLSSETKSYWQERIYGWSPKGFIHLGKWESHFQKIGILFRDYLKCDFTKIFEAQTLEEQQQLYKDHWPHLRWNSFIKVVASEYVFNKFLYKGHFSGKAEHKTESRSPSDFIMQEIQRVFQTQLVRKNYFMQTLFLGKIKYEEGLPLEAHREVFEAIKASKTQIQYLHGNLIEELPKQKYDFISLSDTISYIGDEDANQILQRLHPETRANSTVVIRSFMRAPKAVDKKGWQDLAKENEWAQKKDGTGVYQFHIFKKS